MANKFEISVSASTASSGTAIFYPQGAKIWTIRAVTDNPGANTFNYKYKIVGNPSLGEPQAFQVKTGAGVGDVILTNNDGDGGSLCCEKIFVTWDTLSGGNITIGGRFQD